VKARPFFYARDLQGDVCRSDLLVEFDCLHAADPAGDA
jgi:hypothetical protein